MKSGLWRSDCFISLKFICSKFKLLLVSFLPLPKTKSLKITYIPSYIYKYILIYMYRYIFIYMNTTYIEHHFTWDLYINYPMSDLSYAHAVFFFGDDWTRHMSTTNQAEDTVCIWNMFFSLCLLYTCTLAAGQGAGLNVGTGSNYGKYVSLFSLAYS